MFLPSVPLLLETIKIEDGTVFNLQYHQKRCDESRRKLYQSDDRINLSSIISPPQKGLYRCRIVYAKKIQSIEYIPYIPKKISQLKVVSSDIIYDLKYADRTPFEELLIQHPNTDEVIMEHNGYLTDTTFSNIAFFDGHKWDTPLYPLLKGTMRQKLLDQGIIHERKIRKLDLKRYRNVALINAMLGFKVLNHFTID